ncbi:MAG: hypothetical protein HOE30_18215 [Deltaproteobacteria bacterium]|nr:hypothetical protein [Deltaproteobacteria bacterium]
MTELEAANLVLKNALQELEKAENALNVIQTGVGKVPPKPIALVAEIIMNSKTGIGVKELAQETGLEKRKLYSMIQSLKSQGKIRNRAYGIYEGKR